MKKLILLPLMLATVLASAQLIKMAVPGGTFGRQNKTFSLTDKRDFPSFVQYEHANGFYFDTIARIPIDHAIIYANLKSWLATNFQSLPNVLKLDDSTHLVIHATFDQSSFSIDYRIKDSAIKILLSDWVTNGNPIDYHYERYATGQRYDGGKRSRYNEKKYDLIILTDFENIANWLRINCIPAIGKAATF